MDAHHLYIYKYNRLVESAEVPQMALWVGLNGFCVFDRFSQFPLNFTQKGSAFIDWRSGLRCIVSALFKIFLPLLIWHLGLAIDLGYKKISLGNLSQEGKWQIIRVGCFRLTFCMFVSAHLVSRWAVWGCWITVWGLKCYGNTKSEKWMCVCALQSIIKVKYRGRAFLVCLVSLFWSLLEIIDCALL